MYYFAACYVLFYKRTVFSVQEKDSLTNTNFVLL